MYVDGPLFQFVQILTLEMQGFLERVIQTRLNSFFCGVSSFKFWPLFTLSLQKKLSLSCNSKQTFKLRNLVDVRESPVERFFVHQKFNGTFSIRS